MEDLIDGGWAVIWLSEAEFHGKPAELPAQDCIYPGYIQDSCMSAFSNDLEPEFLELVERENDPNAGKKPLSFPMEENDYIPMYSEIGESMKLDRFWGKCHFGGTSSPCQTEPDGYSEFYLEFDEALGNANLGGDGVAQFDLLQDMLDWSCG